MAAKTRRKPKPQQDTDHTITLLIEVPVFGQPGGRPDIVTAARIMQMLQLSVHSQIAGLMVEGGLVAECHEIPSYDSILGKD